MHYGKLYIRSAKTIQHKTLFTTWQSRQSHLEPNILVKCRRQDTLDEVEWVGEEKITVFDLANDTRGAQDMETCLL